MDLFRSLPPYPLCVKYLGDSLLVDRHLREGRADKIAIVCEGRSLTYAELADQVRRTANGLRDLGVHSGDRVVLVLPDGPQFAASFLGCVRIGAVAVPTNTLLRTADYAYLLRESAARIALVDSRFRRTLEPALDRSDLTSMVILTRDRQAGQIAWDDWLASRPSVCELAATTREDVAFWLWTSGSTGPPKAAPHSHGAPACCCEGYARGVLGIGPDDTTLSASKLFHAYGLGNSLLFPLDAGATTVLHPDRPTPRAVLQLAAQCRPTLFFAVPTLFAAMLSETDHENPYDLGSVRLGISAAEPLPADIYTRWKERFGFEILDGLGSTEPLHIYVSQRPGEVPPGSSGTPVSGYDVRVTNETGHHSGPGEVGDMWVRGSSITPAYWNRPELSAERMRDGWLLTGDKYSVDDDGYYWYAGRSDDMIRVSGQWVSPAEVEAALIEHSAVLESAVVAFENEQGLSKPKAFVVLIGGSIPTDELAAELQTFVKQRITPFKYPRQVEFVAELPKTVTGKIQRFKLRRPLTS